MNDAGLNLDGTRSSRDRRFRWCNPHATCRLQGWPRALGTTAGLFTILQCTALEPASSTCSGSGVACSLPNRYTIGQRGLLALFGAVGYDNRCAMDRDSVVQLMCALLRLIEPRAPAPLETRVCATGPLAARSPFVVAAAALLGSLRREAVQSRHTHARARSRHRAPARRNSRVLRHTRSERSRRLGRCR